MARPSGPSAPRTVLLVEDDDLALKSLTMVVSALGYIVLAVSCGEEALKVVTTKDIHLLMTDFHLPGINGVDLAAEIRKSGLHVPVILISGYLNESVQEKARDAQINVMLPKPPDLKKLEDTLVELLDQSCN